MQPTTDYAPLKPIRYFYFRDNSGTEMISRLAHGDVTEELITPDRSTPVYVLKGVMFRIDYPNVDWQEWSTDEYQVVDRDNPPTDFQEVTQIAPVAGPLPEGWSFK